GFSAGSMEPFIIQIRFSLFSSLWREGYRGRMTATQPFEVQPVATGFSTALTVSRGGDSRAYEIAGGEHHDFLDFFRALAGDFGTRRPHVYDGPAASDGVEP